MSKNVQMNGSARSVIVGAERTTAGAASVAQGVYGLRGNLELVVADIADGLWVFWFNADLTSDPLETPDVPPGSWSAGLQFASGHRYRSAQILQSPLGPDHLEVLALTVDGVLQSWFWSPGPGFARRRADAANEVSGFVAEVDTEGAITVHTDRLDGTRSAVRSDAVGYPERSWSPVETSRTGPLHDVASAESDLIAAGVERALLAPGTARRARSTRDGGMLELTYRDASGGLRHLAVPG